MAKPQTIKQRKRLFKALIKKLNGYLETYPAKEDCDHQMDIFDTLERFQEEMH